MAQRWRVPAAKISLSVAFNFCWDPTVGRREEGRVGGAKLGVMGAARLGVGLWPRRVGLACSGQPGQGGWNGKVGGRRTAISALKIRKQRKDCNFCTGDSKTKKISQLQY